MKVKNRNQIKGLLRPPENSLADLLGNTPDGIMIADKKGVPLFFNAAYRKAVKETFGIDAQSEVALPLLIGDNKEKIRWKKVYRRVLTGETVRISLTGKFRKKDHRYYETVLGPSLQNGSVVGFTEIIRDITIAKITEAIQKGRNETLSSVIDQTFQFIGLLSVDGTLLMANNASLELLGLEESDVLGRKFWEAPWWKHSSGLRNQVKTAIKKAAGGHLFRFEAFHPVPDGSTRHIDVSIKPIREEDGSIIFLVPEGRDITQAKMMEEDLKEAEAELQESNRTLENKVRSRTADLLVANRALQREIEDRVQAEASLKTSEAHLRSILESASGFAIYRLAFDENSPYRLQPTFVSPSIKTVLGVAPRVFTSDSFFDNIHPDDLDRVKKANLEAFETNRFDETCRFFHRVKEEWIWIHAISTGVRNDQGQVTHVNGIFIDTTAERKAEEALKIKAQDLEELNVALKVLLEKRDADKTEIEANLTDNIKGIIEPLMAKLKMSGLKGHQKMIAEVIESSIERITSPFHRNLSKELTGLTPKEIQISNLIKLGICTKEIAEIIGISPRTVDTHRRNLRTKIGIKNKKTNLRTYLLSLD